MVALEWIKFVSEEHGVYIRHARNGKEKVIGKYKADGFFANTVMEFNGCAYHGCPKYMHEECIVQKLHEISSFRCYKKRDEKVPNSSLTREEAY
ncbi:hypothetical protein [Oceanimonas doudoroffii]|uniref:hypothetical protein n=1 Tax=Oceanimonas doudoroffii TaxID=84158 RepID=UPI0011407C35|nr:hypothetical protein [Oceanimonas doudoroffii]